MNTNYENAVTQAEQQLGRELHETELHFWRTYYPTLSYQEAIETHRQRVEEAEQAETKAQAEYVARKDECKQLCNMYRVPVYVLNYTYRVTRSEKNLGRPLTKYEVILHQQRNVCLTKDSDCLESVQFYATHPMAGQDVRSCEPWADLLRRMINEDAVQRRCRG